MRIWLSMMVWLATGMATLPANDTGAPSPNTGLRSVILATHAFEVTVEPTDKDSQDARSADLYMTREPGSGWNRVGACAIQRTNGLVSFSCRVRVPLDGVYYFTSIAGDVIGKTAPPKPDAPAQACVTVDSRVPSVYLSAPIENETLQVGETFRFHWVAQDEHFSIKPIQLSYSTDQGKTWSKIGEKHYNDGQEDWRVPDLKTEGLVVRIDAIDEAGNTASAQARVSLLPAANEQDVPEYAVATDTPQTAPQTGARQQGAGSPQQGALRLAHAGGEDAIPMVAPAAYVTATTPTAVLTNDASPAPAPKSSTPATRTPAAKSQVRSPMAARAAWLKAGNLVRQGRHKDSLRFYQTAVKLDPLFAEAWSDMSMVYRYLGTWEKAQTSIAEALRLRPQEPEYLHNRGEIYHAQGMTYAANALDPKQVGTRKGLLDTAITDYTQALELAKQNGTTSERGETLYRLGEICFYGNQDLNGARAYWTKILDLHAPTPELDPVMHDKNSPRYEEALRAYSRETARRNRLDHWKGWAREMLAKVTTTEEQVRQVHQEQVRKRQIWKGGLFQRRGRTSKNDVVYTTTEAATQGCAPCNVVDLTAAPQTTEIWQPTVPAKTPAYMNSGYGAWADEDDPTARRQ